MQYFHELPSSDLRTDKPISGRTIALKDKILKDRFETIKNMYLANISKTLIIEVGVATCHTQDQFNKKTGRELSFSRIKPLEFKIDRLLSKDEYTKIIITNDEIHVAFSIKQYKDSGKIRVFRTGRFEFLG